MSFFAYIALVSDTHAPRQQLIQLLMAAGYQFNVVALSHAFGAVALYGVAVAPRHLFEVELTGQVQPDGTLVDIETALCDPPDSPARWHHYRACATRLGRVVHAFHDDPDVDALYRSTPLDLEVVRLLRRITDGVDARPIICNLDPDFELRFGRYVYLHGMDAIRQGVWQYTVFTDLDIPLRLVLD